jgi:hypothetical protein
MKSRSGTESRCPTGSWPGENSSCGGGMDAEQRRRPVHVFQRRPSSAGRVLDGYGRRESTRSYGAWGSEQSAGWLRTRNVEAGVAVPGHRGPRHAIASTSSVNDADHPAPDQQWRICIQFRAAPRRTGFEVASSPGGGGRPSNPIRGSRYVTEIGSGLSARPPPSYWSSSNPQQPRGRGVRSAVRRGRPRGARGAGYESFPSRTAFFGTQGFLPTSSRRTGFKGPRPVRRPRLIANGGPMEVVLEPRGGDSRRFPCPGGWPRPDRSLDDVRRIGDGRAVRPGLRAGPSVANETPRAAESSRIVAEGPCGSPWSTIPYQSLSLGQAVPDALSLISTVRLCLTVFYSCPTLTPHHRSPSPPRVGQRPTRRSSSERSGLDFPRPRGGQHVELYHSKLESTGGFRGISNRVTGMRPRASHDLARRLRARERGGHCGSHRCCPVSGRASMADRSGRAESPGCRRRGDGGDRRPFRGRSRPGEP